ncbi:hypothetical protein OIU74_009759 [Salix koriyanagi]|uniref:Uncharacterized protein n=1 Tax=Salix koriyanagi TaxID=2511006 RepID=A0A9Q0TT26_9ROSI|nr:hypothetical protein OIU74_009759 [Salix koriyanagi]
MSLSRERLTKEKGRDIEILEADDQKSEVKGKEIGSQPNQPIEVNKELNLQKSNHEEGSRLVTLKEQNEKVKPSNEGLTVGSKSGEHVPTETTQNNKNKGTKADAIVVTARDDVQGGPLICTMNKMVSLSSETKGKGKEIACEITGSSSEGQPACSQRGDYYEEIGLDFWESIFASPVAGGKGCLFA